MKILYVGHTYTVRANQAKIVALARLPEVEIVLVTPQGWRGPLYANRTDAFDTGLAPNVRHQIIQAIFTGKESAYLFAPSILTLIRKVQPDIVHVEQGAYALCYMQILWALKRFSPRSRAVFFTWWNLPYAPRGIKKIAESFNLAHSACAIAGNVAARDVLRSHGFVRPIHLLPQLGIDPMPYQKQAPSQGTNAAFTIGYAGRITEEKGVLDLVDAISKMKSKVGVNLYIVGAGDALEMVRTRSTKNGVNLMLHPAVRNEDLPQHLARMDVLVLPSHSTPTWVEQFGHILLESMAAGVPVIGSDSGEIPNVIGDAGLIFPEGNTEKLADALDRLYVAPTERAHFAALGRKRIEEHFTNKKLAEAQMNIYRWMMREGRSVTKPHHRTTP